MQNHWKTLASRVVYQNAWIRVREDRIDRGDGREGIYGVVEVPRSVAVLALNQQDEVLLVGQWRYPHGKYTWELPRGASKPGESDVQAAARELREEGGISARQWEYLGETDLANGVTTNTEDVFLATDLEAVPCDPDPEEEIATRWVPFGEAVEWVLSGRITECTSQAAILRLEVLRARSQP